MSRHDAAEMRAASLRRRLAASHSLPKRSGRSSHWVWIPLLFLFGLAGAAWYETERARADAGLKRHSHSPVFRYCRDARAAGFGPMLRGQPGYAIWLDADRDGIACEWN